MNEARQQQYLAAQTGLTRKVYDAVPIQEIWSEFEIFKHLRNAGSSIGLHVVRACLGDMKDIGLVKEIRKEHYQRVSVVPKAKPLNPVIASVPAMPAANKVTPTKKTAPTPLDLLAALSSELVIVGNEFGARLTSMANRVEEVALSIETQRETDATAMAKVKQFQALLKDFGAPA